jgi:hypothetical protein
MCTISFVGWIANAAARLVRQRGAVTKRAKIAGCSRQSVYDHAGKVKAAVETEHAGGPPRADLVEENEGCRQENIQLWNWLSHTIELPLAKLQEFAVTAVAMGLSHSQVRALLVILQGAKASPSRSTIYR